jgi:hypothetical protein
LTLRLPAGQSMVELVPSGHLICRINYKSAIVSLIWRL